MNQLQHTHDFFDDGEHVVKSDWITYITEKCEICGTIKTITKNGYFTLTDIN